MAPMPTSQAPPLAPQRATAAGQLAEACQAGIDLLDYVQARWLGCGHDEILAVAGLGAPLRIYATRRQHQAHAPAIAGLTPAPGAPAPAATCDGPARTG